MGFDGFILLSLFYCAIGIGVVRRLIRERRATFDLNFTPADRALVDQAAFFILLPISVALHEFGHALGVWGFGGEVIDFGYYVFAGYVSYNEPFTAVQQILVALAGPLVNVLLAAAALGVVFRRRPPLRAAYNELLLQFAILSTVNALVFYPLLDVLSGLSGDWSQMYFNEAPALSVAILVGHVGILALGWWAWRNPAVQQRVAVLTGLPAGIGRGPLGGLRRAATRSAPVDDGVDGLLGDAGRRVADGWPVATDVTVARNGEQRVLFLGWVNADGERRAVVGIAAPTGEFDLWGTTEVANDRADGRANGPALGDATAAVRQHLKRVPALTDVDRLTLELRLAMETVEAWRPAPSPQSRPLPRL